MKTRWWIAMLLLLNVAALAWQWDAFGRWGWGPNLQREPERLKQQIRPEALKITRPGQDALAPAAAALARVAAPLIQTLLAFEKTGFAPLQARFEARDVLKGRRVHTSDGMQGTSLGVSASGALRLQTDAGVVDIHSAEVSVRPFAKDTP